jgi:hypothetical protein
MFSDRHDRFLSFAPYEMEISAFGSQLTITEYDIDGVGSNSWMRERSPRFFAEHRLRSQNLHPSDLVIVSDLDEVASPSALRRLAANPPIYACLQLKFYAY